MPFFPPPARVSRTARCWLLLVAEPFGVAVLLRADRLLRYALLNAAGLCYAEFREPVRPHYVEHLCAGNLRLAEMKPVDFGRDAARALVAAPEWEMGEWGAGGHGARSDLIAFYRVAVDEPRTPPQPNSVRGQNTACAPADLPPQVRG